MSKTATAQSIQGYDPSYELTIPIEDMLHPVPIQAMLHAIHQNQSPHFAWLATNLSDTHLRILGPAIAAQGPAGRLQILDLSINHGITDASVPRIIDLIHNSAIQSLDLSETSITNAGIQRIAVGLRQATRAMCIIFSEDLTITTSMTPPRASPRRP